MRFIAAALALLALGACEDLRHFAGTWEGPVSRDPVLQRGFAADARLAATIETVTRASLEMSLTVPGMPAPQRFLPIRRAAGDTLGDLRFDGEPLRTYLGWLTIAGAEPTLAVVSLFAEDRIDVRLIRGPDDTYALFSLHRQ